MRPHGQAMRTTERSSKKQRNSLTTDSQPTTPLINRVVNTAPAGAPSPSTVTTEGSGMFDENQRRRTQLGVTRFVAETIFPHLKFLDSRQFTLDYSTEPQSICNIVLTRCLRTTCNGKDWWENSGKKYVRAGMSRLRSDRMQGIKQAFTG